MHFTKARDLLLACLIGLIGGYLLFDLAHGTMQSIPRLAGGTLLLLALAELILGFWVRNRILAARVTDAIVIARLVVLAKASSMLGAIMLGGWIGALGYLLPRSSHLVAAAEDAPSAVVGAVCAAALVPAALWLEHCCRTPDQSDRDHVDESPEQRY